MPLFLNYDVKEIKKSIGRRDSEGREDRRKEGEEGGRKEGRKGARVEAVSSTDSFQTS